MWQGLTTTGALSGARNSVSRLLASGSSWVGSLGDKLRTFVEPANSDDFCVEARQNQEERSRRILLHLLARSGRFDELLEIAETTEIADEAMWVVMEIVAEKPESMASCLVRLGHGDSLATVPAITALFNEKLSDRMVPLFASRLKSGEMLTLIANGRAKAFSVVDLFGALERCGVKVDSVAHFDQIWDCLSSEPQRQYDLLAEVFGDSAPGGFRYVPEPNLVPVEAKLRALEILLAVRPPGYIRTLWYASRSEDDVTAWNATVALMDYWQSESGKVPELLEPFSMLDTSLLYFLCQMSAAFQWSGPAGVSELHKQLCDDKAEIERLDPESQRSLGLQDRIERIQEQLIEITERRVESLQPLIDTITRYMNLPHAKLVASDTDACAAYAIGFGTVLFSRRVLFDDRPLSEDFMASVLHELLHMEQDVLMIRMIADDLNLKFGRHARLLKPLFERYCALMGYAPDSIFLLEVLRRRADLPLTQLERVRAERISEAARECSANTAELERIGERLERIGASYFELKNGSYDQFLLEFLRDDVSPGSLFQNGRVPGILLQEIQSCRQDVRELVGATAGDLPGKQDAIARAQELWLSDAQSPVNDIVDRLKTVLMQVLNEEWRSLERRNSDLRRAGYHEAEAYEISDRVEVIVKAIRKNWYSYDETEG